HGKRKKKAESAALNAKEKANQRRRSRRERTKKSQNNIDQEAEGAREQSVNNDDPSQDSDQRLTQE
ncbi:hypothetical protein BGX20_003666, partial [Mortierella sp. AD010]